MARKLALAIAIGYAWSMLGAPVAMALTNQPLLPKGHTRKLSQLESEGFVGAQHAVSYSVIGGSTYPWEGSDKHQYR
jgi:hypothetical protein